MQPELISGKNYIKKIREKGLLYILLPSHYINDVSYWFWSEQIEYNRKMAQKTGPISTWHGNELSGLKKNI